MSLRLFLFVFLATILLALPRFAHQTPDSIFYLHLAKYFRGDDSSQNLREPYSYRVLVPFLAAQGPTQRLDINFALLNLISTVMTYILIYFYFLYLLQDQIAASVAVVIMVFSFPTINYASGILTDPAGLLFLVLSLLSLLEHRYLLFMISSVLGVMTRDANLVIVLVLLIFSIVLATRYKNFKFLWQCLLGIPPIFAYIIIRIYFRELDYRWLPQLSIFENNLRRPISWLTVMLSLLPLLILLAFVVSENRKRWIADFRMSPESKALLIAVCLATCSLFIFSLFTAFMSGRFVWPLYLALVPCLCILLRKTSLYEGWIAPNISKVFKVP